MHAQHLALHEHPDMPLHMAADKLEFFPLAQKIFVHEFLCESPDIVWISQLLARCPVMTPILRWNHDLLLLERSREITAHLPGCGCFVRAVNRQRREAVANEEHASAKEGRLDEDVVDAAFPGNMIGRHQGQKPSELLYQPDTWRLAFFQIGENYLRGREVTSVFLGQMPAVGDLESRLFVT